MNKIALTGPVWLASDLHLGPATPATSEAFLAFLQAAREEAGARCCCRATSSTPGSATTRSGSPALAGDGVEGAARDGRRHSGLAGARQPRFPHGRGTGGAIGAKLLPEPALLETDYGTVLLTHGDEFCTDDAPYQQFRAMVRNPQWQAAFLAKTIPERLAMAQQARGESQAANQMKSQEIMDVNPGAIEAVFRDTGVSLLVHGHTHRPARHVLEVDGKKRERWVLPDWDCDHAQPPRAAGW